MSLHKSRPHCDSALEKRDNSGLNFTSLVERELSFSLLCIDPIKLSGNSLVQVAFEQHHCTNHDSIAIRHLRNWKRETIQVTVY